MRPFILDSLFRPITTLSGIGERTARLIEKLCGGRKILDLLWHTPIDIVDRRFSPKIADAPPGKIVTLTLTVTGYSFPARRGAPMRVHCRDETGVLDLVFFHASADYIRKTLPEGETRIVSGKVDLFRETPQIVHPDAIGTLAERNAIAIIEPIYPLTQGVTNRVLGRATIESLKSLPDLPEWLDPEWKRRAEWPDWKQAMETLHRPEHPEELLPTSATRTRLAYDEILAGQLALAMVRRQQRRSRGRILKGTGALQDRLRQQIPFALTNAQERALSEIREDLEGHGRMLRLLQGDVGSGKTIVACLAMLHALESGTQAALMAPTEILARQHAAKLKPWLAASGVRHVVLTGRDKGKSRNLILEQIATGKAQIVIGTHAIFQEDVIFQDLALAVIDEQHRFGVQQRLQLSERGKGVNVLLMTATPIPRTLTLTAYGDMDVSRLDEKPPGRQPVDTRLIPCEKTDSMVDGLRRQLAEGARAYWVCPLVEESETLDLSAAEERFAHLDALFPGRVGLVHGRMKGEDKDHTMTDFAEGRLEILVATTVIEVGVDVPEATIMVIEHAERFGLAQLHQLRGRVGRGHGKSVCLLLYSTPLNDHAKERLQTLRSTEDGFLIAEKDLDLRGGGELLGTRQSGLPDFRIADIATHADLFPVARDDCRLILDKDPDLKTPRGEALRTLLYLFERDQGIRLLKSG